MLSHDNTWRGHATYIYIYIYILCNDDRTYEAQQARRLSYLIEARASALSQQTLMASSSRLSSFNNSSSYKTETAEVSNSKPGVVNIRIARYGKHPSVYIYIYIYICIIFISRSGSHGFDFVLNNVGIVVISSIYDLIN